MLSSVPSELRNKQDSKAVLFVFFLNAYLAADSHLSISWILNITALWKYCLICVRVWKQVKYVN